MIVEIDQSGKVEQTNRDTVVGAIFDGTNRSAICFKAKDKRFIQEIFRKQLKGHLFIYRTFAALVFLLVKEKVSSQDRLIIDTEYTGKEGLIKDIILEYFDKSKLTPPEIIFQRIGNTPPVHYLVYDVYVGNLTPDKIISLTEVIYLAIKKDRGPKD